MKVQAAGSSKVLVTSTKTTESYNLKITAVIDWELLKSLLQMLSVCHEEMLK
jgi:hypothetical protein